jgi:hypothetical protein
VEDDRPERWGLRLVLRGERRPELLLHA